MREINTYMHIFSYTRSRHGPKAPRQATSRQGRLLIPLQQMPKSDRRECQEIHVLCVQGMLCYAECTATAMRTHAHVTDDGASPRNAPVGILCTQDQREIPSLSATACRLPLPLVLQEKGALFFMKHRL